MKWVRAQALSTWVQELFIAAGLEPSAAAVVAEHLVEANLRGVDSHGVIRVPGYIQRLRAGGMNPQPRPRVIRQEGPVALVDGDNGPGQVAGLFATELTIHLARQHGVGVVGVYRSSHYGMAAYYVMKMARAGLIGWSMTNADPHVVPFGGTVPVLGTNPIAFAAMAPQGMIVLDMATSQAAMGKIYLARERNEPIPEGWAVDAVGRPTTNPHRAVACVPLGGAKGFGLGLMVEVLAGVFTGAAVMEEVGKMEDHPRPQNVGHFFLALDPNRTVGRGTFQQRMARVWERIKQVPPAEGVAEVMLPGEPEARTREERRRTGVPLPDPVHQKLCEVSRELHVEVPHVGVKDSPF